MPVELIVTIVVAPYLIKRLPPDSTIVKLVVTKVGAEPEILIGHVPLAPVPVGLGTSVPISKPRLVLAVAAVDAFVPPLEMGTGELRLVGGICPDESRLLAKFARFIAWVIVCLSA